MAKIDLNDVVSTEKVDKIEEDAEKLVKAKEKSKSKAKVKSDIDTELLDKFCEGTSLTSQVTKEYLFKKIGYNHRYYAHLFVDGDENLSRQQFIDRIGKSGISPPKDNRR